jgi:hypothetical protein
MKNYSGMNAEALVNLYNEKTDLFGEDKITGRWSKSKEALIAKINDLVARNSARPKPGTIRFRALELLCQAEYHEDRTKDHSPEDNTVAAEDPNSRSVGISYVDIVDLILEDFPLADTSVACLRWYAVKVRGNEFGYEGYRLAQHRPRSKRKENKKTPA